MRTYTYETFGTLVAATGTLPNPFTYTAREFDPETGLLYYRARYYDPSIGRFLSEDPLRFVAGINFYTYARNNPVLATDPLGLFDSALFARGVVNTSAGVGATVGGVAVAGGTGATGVGAAVGTALAVGGAVTTGLGVAQVITSLVTSPGQVDVPGNIFEAIAQYYDTDSARDLAALLGLASSLLTGRFESNICSTVGSIGNSGMSLADSIQRIWDTLLGR